ncbi:MFS transporter [Serinibacter arcticus]|uniref:MFS transporter n=1 Tax=Serinibacter arcticus TaxID=1655435 RepID=A0A2U1ZXF6_9MICO|nr:MFS transporter [Serinibacter arcticus]PWD51651.1 MFS transporter [Serinibacter arcticus]
MTASTPVPPTAHHDAPAPAPVRPTTPWRYGVGMFGTSIPINLIKGSMLYFYVDLLGMDAAIYAAVYAVYGILDAIDNPIFGYLSDRTRTRWGRRKPYLVVGSLVLLGAMIALFSVPGSVAASATSLVIWFAVFAILSEMADSLINANYGALLPELFPAEKKRATANGVRQGAQLVAMILALGLTPILAQNVLGCSVTATECADPTIGYSRLAVIFGVLGVGVILYMAFGVRENPAIDSEERPPFFASIKQIVTNRYFWTIGVVNACYGSAMAIVLNGLQLYVRYTLGGGGLEATVLQVAVVLGAIGMLALWARAVRRWGAERVWKTALPIAAVAFIPIYFADSLLTAVLAGLCIAVGYSGVLATNDLIMARVLDDDARRHGVHREGIFLSAFGVLGRLNGLIVAGALASLTVFFGYRNGNDPGEDPATTFRVYLSVYPFLLLLLGTAISRFVHVPGWNGSRDDEATEDPDGGGGAGPRRERVETFRGDLGD